MGIFSNYKFITLRDKVEGDYDSRLETISSSLNNLSKDQQLKATLRFVARVLATTFAKNMNRCLFHPQSGVFKNDISNLDEYKFNEHYRFMLVWFCWFQTSLNKEGIREPENIKNSLDDLENGLGINRTFSMALFNSLNDLNHELLGVSLYRWCMLSIGHIDSYWETMHGNSPDCSKFIVITKLAIEENLQAYERLSA
jgi:hypothetical protein